MVNLKKFNSQSHRYIWQVLPAKTSYGAGYRINGSIGEILYTGCKVSEAIKKYNYAAYNKLGAICYTKQVGCYHKKGWK